MRWRRFAPLLVLVVPIALAPPLGVAYASTLPDVSAVADPLPSDTVIYAADNTTILADVHPPGYQHYDESLSSMGAYLPEAAVAIEDHNFYSEPGVDPAGIARATVTDLKARSAVEGASTITQQLVKLRLVGDEPSLQRKLNEAWLAFEVEHRYSKSEILQTYLNDVQFGNSAVGAGAASHIYFHKKTSDLDLAQAAMLAGIIRGPTHYDPFVHWQVAKNRQHEVLNAMVDQGKVSQADADRAFAEDLTPPAHIFMPANDNNTVASGFVNYVITNLIKTYGKAETYGGGLRVVTTLNPQLQTIGQHAISATQSSLSWRNVQQGALVAIDPTSGAIIAMVSSANQNVNGGQYNLAVWPPRNPGSSMKMFTYTAAINSGQFTMTTPVQDAPFTYTAPGIVYTPQNYDGRFHGTCQVQECMGNSLNIPAVKVELGVGVPNVVEMARAMGAPPWQQQANGTFSNDDALNSFGPSLTLGGYGETPLQMATGASVLAAQGTLHQPYAISKIDRGGRTIYTHADASKQVVDPKVAFIMAAMMSKDANRAMIFGRNSQLVVPGFQVAVKTGTSDSFADAWTIGFTPRIAVAVWMGNADWRMKMTQGSDSYYVAVPAWHEFLANSLPLLGPDGWYQAPAGLISAYGNYYLPGTQPTSPPEPSFAPAPSSGGEGEHKKHKH